METWQAFIRRKDLEFKKAKPIPMKDIGRAGTHYFEREAWTFMPQSNLKEKVFVIERLKKVHLDGKAVHSKTSLKGSVEYRIGYYMIGKNGNKKGRWTWGQFCPMIPKEDFNKLMKKAAREGTVG
ncbi:MAG: hypothetical protein KDK66_03465 [Deltaproteobacteria bacterium]|nr:hypothetical protein [Deltaproteobacteria bacterium]